jgi:hypothetical protein
MRFDLGSPDAPPLVTSSNVPGGLPVDIAFDAAGANVHAVMYASQALFIAPVDDTSGAQGTVAPMVGATGVAVDAFGTPILFAREPPAFFYVNNLVQPGVDGTAIQTYSVLDTGHDLFHHASQQGGSLACASCHPEGREDGHVWSFQGHGPRRTPSLVGGLLATAPFHWDGSLATIDALMLEVFTKRMGGFVEDGPHVAAVARFLDAIPRIPIAVRSSPAYDHGKALFESAELGCTECHNGPHLTNNATLDVGTGQPFQVPSLIGVGLRAPYLHDGCAATLADRFGACGGGDQHGHTSQLAPADVADLSLYVGSL